MVAVEEVVKRHSERSPFGTTVQTQEIEEMREEWLLRYYGSLLKFEAFVFCFIRGP